MKFRVGQIVELVDNHGMSAQLGADAIVEKMWGEFLNVQWRTNYGCSSSGSYFLSRFKPKFKKNEQLLFSFMRAMDGT